MIPQVLADFHAQLRATLCAQRTVQGHWRGHLASSALATATATAALSEIDPHRHRALILAGLDWLCRHVNEDGGWGDTVHSPSNINTTTLVWAALNVAERCDRGSDARYQSASRGAEAWLARCCGLPSGTISARHLVEAILAFYGSDRTFSTPICSLTCLCGRLGPRHQAFALVPQLPFELATAPRRLFRWLRLPVVSYAIPALVAIGQSRHHHRPSPWPWMRALRRLARAPTLALVERMQPENGGFLEAVPLTSFVALNLAACGLRHHRIVTRAVDFLYQLVRKDGAWPIDTDLATWCSTLAVKALAQHPDGIPDDDQRQALTAWLLDQQHRHVHPFTAAAPGGWGWSDQPGSIADADDTPGALLALRQLAPADPAVRQAAWAGVSWLLDLQNRDGGIPTFCKGWNRLPFDRSAPDITAHTLIAWQAWHKDLPPALARRVTRASERAIDYLIAAQDQDGAWTPLWFGNQWCQDQRNRCYGTARVLIALRSLHNTSARCATARRRAAAWLIAHQHHDGAWGGGDNNSPPSIEETALAVDALCGITPPPNEAIDRGLAWLHTHSDGGRYLPSAPIGLYFAKLWYDEQLYPLLFSCAAVAAVWAMRTPGTTTTPAHHR